MKTALALLFQGDPETWGIIGRSILFSFLAVGFSLVPGVPIGIALGWQKTRLRNALIAIVMALSALPTVVIGLAIYSLISRAGLLGFLGILYTPAAVVAGEFFLALPLIISVVVSAFREIDVRFVETIETLGLPFLKKLALAVVESHNALVSAAVMAFARVIGEVGVAMMLGGNIRGLTRTMTTSIAFDTAKGDYERAVSLGIVLFLIAILINIVSTAQARRK